MMDQGNSTGSPTAEKVTPASDPAFPHMMVRGHRDYASGLSIRDYFAAQALAGLCANPGGPFQANANCGWAIVNCSPRDIADECYRLADAMTALSAAGVTDQSRSNVSGSVNQ